MRTSPRSPRRLTALAATLTVTALALTACGQGDRGDDGAASAEEEAASGEAVSIRFAWWGSDHYHEMYQEVADAFMAENPDVEIVTDFTDWGGYWDKLATTVAAGDTPDVLMQEQRYLREYAERGVLADLSQTDIATDAMDQGTLETGEVDGELVAIPTGVNVFSVLANTKVFADAGVPLPDDTTWSWEDYAEVATQISASGTGAIGRQDLWNDAAFNIFARQRGEQLFTEDGELGYTDETLVDFWEVALGLQESGGQPPASTTVELETVGPERSLVATNAGGMVPEWTNQLSAVANAAGQDIELLRWPGESQGERTGMYFKPALYASMSAQTEHPEAAARFIDFMLNSETAGDIILADLGLPANLDIRERIVPKLPEVDRQSAEFVADLADEVVDSPPVPPAGAGEAAAVMSRINSEVLFERLTPEQGAAQLRTELEAILSS
ncbi:ABC transporter substrate-binding protein [Cellulomonas aerilata]|uniref:ABC transporter substrate-binding protein n=2 Tax=Cellulomonas aerilata TaxID=515326 RepID=UPI0031E09914